MTGKVKGSLNIVVPWSQKVNHMLFKKKTIENIINANNNFDNHDLFYSTNKKQKRNFIESNFFFYRINAAFTVYLRKGSLAGDHHIWGSVASKILKTPDLTTSE